METNKIYQGNSLEVLKTFPDESIQTCITSPPYYGLRDYGVDGQIGLEETPEEYVQSLVNLFREVKRVLKEDGTLWLNLGDTYAGGGGVNGIPEDWDSMSVSNREKYPNLNDPKRNAKKIGYKKKDLMGIPWLVAFALQKDGWYLRQDIIWSKPNPMPESVTDRCTKSHEYIFLLSKSQQYYFDHESIKEPANYDGRKATKLKGSPKYEGKMIVPGSTNESFAGRPHERWKENEDGVKVRNKRSVWTVNKQPFPDAHFATFPEDLIQPCVIAGAPEGGVVLDPFSGAGTTAVVATKHNRNYVGIELNPEYIEISEKRLEPVHQKVKEIQYKEKIVNKFFDT